jgi:hypothetical protein
MLLLQNTANKSIYCVKCIGTSLSNSQFISFSVRKEKCMFEQASLHFLVAEDEINFRITWRCDSILAIYTLFLYNSSNFT